MIISLLATVAGAGSLTGCHEGAFRLSDGRTLAVMAIADAKALRFRLDDGTAGRLAADRTGTWRSSPGGPGWVKTPERQVTLSGQCGSHRLQASVDGTSLTAERVRLQARDVRFPASDGSMLAGRLVLPAGTGRVPVAVHVHGSERTSALATELNQYLLPALGVGYFLHDKRGSGGSGGNYSQDFSLLASDVAAAAGQARSLAGTRAERLGLVGFSQGGWVAPLASAAVKPDFVVIAYGLAISPAEEDAEQVRDEIARAGFPPTAMPAVREVTDATAAVIGSGFRDGFDQLRLVKAKHGKQPWFRVIRGEYSGDILRTSPMLLKSFGPRRLSGTPWRHDPLPPLKAITSPMLWVLAGDDREAPSDSTLARLAALQADERRLDVVLYPAADHGMVRVNQARERLGYARSYFPLLANWIRTGLVAKVPDAEHKVR